jgi:hypothetical protein
MGTCGLCFSLGAQAQVEPAHVQNRCSRLGPGTYEELDARVLLLLHGQGQGHAPPAVVCTKTSAWLEWEGRRIDIVGRGPIEDEVVDIVEAQLQQADASTTQAAEDLAVSSHQPMLEGPEPVAVRSSEPHGGGVALGIETEFPSARLGPAVGPAYDFGGSVGPLLLLGREAFRFTTGGLDAVLMDFEAGVGWGAPLNPDALFGVVARVGAEWLIAYPASSSAEGALVPIADLGVRVAHPLSRFDVWLGLDAHLRLSQLSFQGDSSRIANDLSASATLGVALVDWRRK